MNAAWNAGILDLFAIQLHTALSQIASWTGGKANLAQITANISEED